MIWESCSVNNIVDVILYFTYVWFNRRLVRDRKSADRKSLDRKAGKPDKAPEFITKPRRQFVDEGQSAKFKASYDGPHSTKLLWTFNGMVLSNDSKHKVLSNDSRYNVYTHKHWTRPESDTEICVVKYMNKFYQNNIKDWKSRNLKQVFWC